MSKNNIVIREIESKDNTQIEEVIRACFPEFGLPLEGTAYADSETSRMFESYQKDKEVYYVVEVDGVVLGGGGLKSLKGFGNEVCEIQKMYFAPKARGKGLGKKMFQKCLDKAKALGYKKCYLESATELEAAIHIYEQFGFKRLENPLGDTGHFSCGVWMLKGL